MSLRQDRLTFFGVLIAVVVAVLGYLQLGRVYPVQSQAEDPAVHADQAQETDPEKTPSDPATRQEDAAP